MNKIVLDTHKCEYCKKPLIILFGNELFEKCEEHYLCPTCFNVEMTCENRVRMIIGKSKVGSVEGSSFCVTDSGIYWKGYDVTNLSEIA